MWPLDRQSCFIIHAVLVSDTFFNEDFCLVVIKDKIFNIYGVMYNDELAHRVITWAVLHVMTYSYQIIHVPSHNGIKVSPF